MYNQEEKIHLSCNSNEKTSSKKIHGRIKMTEIKETEPKRFPCFKEACKQYSMDEIYTLAEGMYLIEVQRKGGVIDE